VRFTAVPGPQYRGPEALVQPLTASTYSDFATGSTDQAGKTGVLVRLGRTAGPARIVVTVPTLGLLDTVRLTVKPGNGVRVLVTPGDTMLYAGKSFTLRGGVADRLGNPRTDPVTWSSSAPGLTVTSAGVVTATTVGRYYIRASGTVGSIPGLDSASVNVVPTGRFAGLTGYYYDIKISSFDVDGTNETTLASATDGGIGVHPAWIPGTSTVVYTTVANNLQILYAVGADAAPKPFFTTTPAGVTHQAEPTPTADGKWLYFSAYDTQCSQFDYCVARAKIDGSAYELLVTTASRQPAPSPDGSKVAYMTPGDQMIRVLDVATRTTSSWSVPGLNPAWSPDGTKIAYRTSSGGLALVTPAGSVQSLPSTVYTGSVSGWSPDGKWLIVTQGGAPALVDAATGSAIPLRYPTTIYGSMRVPSSMK
jgi:Tol biopolymer transport system component